VHTANLALTFLLELGAIAAYAATAIVRLGWLWGSVVALIVVVAFVAVWSRWIAPRSARRLPTARRIPVVLAVLGGGAVALVFAAPVVAIVDAALIALNAILLTAFRQWDGDERVEHVAP
jgi:hypothetical protein